MKSACALNTVLASWFTYSTACTACCRQVARHCQEGFKAAVDLNCYEACVNGGGSKAFVIERRLDEVCNGALRDTPRPLCHDSCVRGYQSGVADMSARLVKRMAEVRVSVVVVDTEAQPATSERHAL